MSARINLGTYDAETVLHKPTTAAITTSAAGVVGSTAKVIDFGDDASRMDAKVIVEVADASVGTGEKHVINVQISDDNFDADIYNVATLELGNATQLVGDTDLASGRFELPFCNVHNGVAKRYVRTYATITNPSPANSPAASLSYIAYLVPA
jgi:hypothetical protein